MTWRAWNGRVVHSDGDAYPDEKEMRAAIGRVEQQVESGGGRVLAAQGWPTLTPVVDIERRKELLLKKS